MVAARWVGVPAGKVAAAQARAAVAREHELVPAARAADPVDEVAGALREARAKAEAAVRRVMPAAAAVAGGPRAKTPERRAMRRPSTQPAIAWMLPRLLA